MVEIFNDAVEIISPGWFVEGQDPDEHLSGKSVSPKSRNQLIAQTLFMSGDIESQGTGIKRIKDFCDEAGMSVEYVRTPDGTKLIFHRNDAFGQSLTVGPTKNTVPLTVPDDTLNGTQYDTLNLSDRQIAILKILRSEPSVIGTDIAERIGVGLRTARRELKSLQDKGLISREGSDKTGCWIVNERTE